MQSPESESSSFGTPNLFVLGAAKCGTTSLWHILSRHPDIQTSHVKEPSFYCSYFQDIRNPVIYYSLFDNRAKWRVDCSTVYLTNPETHEILKLVYPEARFIVMLRDPVQRSHALYRWMRRHNHSDGQPYEPIDSFSEALSIENERFHSPGFWTDCRQYPYNFFYARSSQYDEQIKRYLNVFPREQILVLTLADLSRDPISTCERIAQFLNLDAGPLIRDAEWKFNVDLNPLQLSASESDFLNLTLAAVKPRTEDLLGTKLDFSI